MSYKVKYHTYPVNDEATDRKLKGYHRTANLNRDLYSEGQAWSESGKKLEDADLELRNNFNFIDGFNRGERLKKINKLLETKGKLENNTEEEDSKKIR